MLRYDVLCIGSATVDNFMTVDKPISTIKLGDKVLVDSLEKHSGGGATNSAAALSKLGLRVKILTKLGNDHDADFVRKELHDYKIRNVCLHHSRKNTDSTTIISSTKENDRIIYVHKGSSADLAASDFKYSQVRKAKWVYLASLMGRSFLVAKSVANYVQKKKIKLLFNPSLYLAEKGRKYLKPVLEDTNILVLNKEEALMLLGVKKSERSKKESGTNKKVQIKKLLLGLINLGPEIVVITNGEKKIYAYHEQKIYTLIPPKVKVVHTAGSGDAFTAGLLAGMIKKYSFADALKLGQANACSVIQHIGTKNKLLGEKEAQMMINKYKIKVKVEN